MKLTHKFAEMTAEKRPQDPSMDGTGLRFETLDHGGEYPDTMPQAIKLTDAEGRSCIYVPITQNGRVVDSQGYSLDLEVMKCPAWAVGSDHARPGPNAGATFTTRRLRSGEGSNPTTSRTAPATIIQSGYSIAESMLIRAPYFFVSATIRRRG